jgi:hypothetical protein
MLGGAGAATRADLVAELAPCAVRAVSARFGRLVAGEVDAPAFGRLVPPAVAFHAAERQDEDVAVGLLVH